MDPPAVVGACSSQPAPYFASELACEVANLIVGRPFLEQLPGRTFEGRTVAVAGKDCLAAGLVAAMLGARVACIASRRLRPDVVRNVRLFQKDTLDYTQTKSHAVSVVVPRATSGSLLAEAVCESVSAPPLIEVIVVTQSGLEELCEEWARWQGSAPTGEDDGDEVLSSMEAHTGLAAAGRGDAAAALGYFLGALVPPRASTRVLLVGDGDGPDASPTRATRATTKAASGEYSGAAATGACDGGGGGGFLGTSLPPGWGGRSAGLLLARFPVTWLQRQDSESTSRRAPALAPLRKYMAPMGAATAKCGCGGHPQKVRYNRWVTDPEWQANHARLRDALEFHNQWKQSATAQVLDEARGWAEKGRSQETSVSTYGTSTSRGFSNSAGNSTLDGGFSSLDGGLSALDGGLSTLESGWSCSLEDDTPLSSRADAAWHPRVGRGSEPVLPNLSPLLPSARSPRPVRGSRTSRGRDHGRTRVFRYGKSASMHVAIVERHISPPHWYSCNRPYYGPPTQVQVAPASAREFRDLALEDGAS